jgi:hypothetical protein
MIQFNLSNATLKNKDFTPSSNFEDLIFEGEGYASLSDEYMDLSCDGFEIVINYSVDLSGRISYSRGDYWTPSYTEVEVDDVDITINSITIDEYEVDLTPELTSVFEKIVNKLI